MLHPKNKAVIDSTVFVSAAIGIDAGRTTAARTLVEDALVRQGLFRHYTSMPIIYELGDVLSRARIAFEPENIVDYIALIHRASVCLDNVQGVVMGCRDPRDDKVLEAAVNGRVRYIVSRDKDLLEASPGEKYAISKVGVGIREHPVEVVSVETFLYDVLGYDRTSGGETSRAT